MSSRCGTTTNLANQTVLSAANGLRFNEFLVIFLADGTTLSISNNNSQGTFEFGVGDLDDGARHDFTILRDQGANDVRLFLEWCRSRRNPCRDDAGQPGRPGGRSRRPPARTGAGCLPWIDTKNPAPAGRPRRAAVLGRPAHAGGDRGVPRAGRSIRRDDRLIAYYRFDEAGGDIVKDLSTNGFDGTLGSVGTLTNDAGETLGKPIRIDSPAFQPAPSIAGVGDVLRDGLSDWAVINAPLGDVFVVPGNFVVGPVTDPITFVDDVIGVVKLSAAHDLGGFVVRPAGNVDGGLPDLLVTAEGADLFTDEALAGRRSTFLVLGDRLASGSLEAVARRLEIAAMQGVGDIDRDGFDDLAAAVFEPASTLDLADNARLELFAVNGTDRIAVQLLAPDQPSAELGFQDGPVPAAATVTAADLPSGRGGHTTVLSGDAVFTVLVNGVPHSVTLESRNTDGTEFDPLLGGGDANNGLLDLVSDLNFAIGKTEGLVGVVEARLSTDAQVYHQVLQVYFGGDVTDAGAFTVPDLVFEPDRALFFQTGPGKTLNEAPRPLSFAGVGFIGNSQDIRRIDDGDVDETGLPLTVDLPAGAWTEISGAGINSSLLVAEARQDGLSFEWLFGDPDPLDPDRVYNVRVALPDTSGLGIELARQARYEIRGSGQSVVLVDQGDVPDGATPFVYFTAIQPDNDGTIRVTLLPETGLAPVADTLAENTTGSPDADLLGLPDGNFASLGTATVTYDFEGVLVVAGAGTGPDFLVHAPGSNDPAASVDPFTLVDVQVSADGLTYVSVKASEEPQLAVNPAAQFGFTSGQVSDGTGPSVLAAASEPAGTGTTGFILSGDATLSITVGTINADITVPRANTDGSNGDPVNASLADLIADLNAAISATTLIGLVEAREAGGIIELFAVNQSDAIAVNLEGAAAEFGFTSGQMSSFVPSTLTASAVPTAFALSGDAALNIAVNGISAEITLLAANTDGTNIDDATGGGAANASTQDLVADVNFAIAETLELSGILEAREGAGGVIELVAVGAANLTDDITVSFTTTDPGDPARELGFDGPETSSFTPSTVTADTAPNPTGTSAFILSADTALLLHAGPITGSFVLLAANTDGTNSDEATGGGGANATAQDLVDDLNFAIAQHFLFHDVVTARLGADGRIELAAVDPTDTIEVNGAAAELGFDGTEESIFVPSVVTADDSAAGFAFADDTIFTISVNDIDHAILLTAAEMADNGALAGLVEDLNTAFARTDTIAAGAATLDGLVQARATADGRLELFARR